MASTNIPAPRLPDAPAEYNQQHMADLIRALEAFMSQERNPGELRGTKMTLTALPTSASGLETGALYNDSGTIKVAP